MTAGLVVESADRPLAPALRRSRGRDLARPRRRARRPRTARVAAAVGVVLLAGLGTAARLADYRPLVISSGSMTPGLAVGDLVVSRSTPAGGLHPGDIVTFRDPALGNRLVTHRVVEVAASAGQVAVTTKGDANLVPEHWSASQSAPVGLLVGHVPAHGEWLLWLQSGWTRIGLVSLLCGWLLVASLRRIWQAAR